MTVNHVTIVGTSAAGVATAEALRRQGFTGRLTMIDADADPFYDRPPLSKHYLTDGWTDDRVALRPPGAVDALDAEQLLGTRAVGLDVAERVVHTDDGRAIRSAAIVIATGVRPRTLPRQEDLAGVHLLRSRSDAAALREAFASGRSVVVVGNGVLGSELAAAAAGRGAPTTLVGSQLLPMSAQLGTTAATALAARHRAAGVVLRNGVRAERLVGTERFRAVALTDGTEVRADVAVAAIGAVPVVDWLEGSGLELDDGVVCDASCRAAPGIWAVGDVARWSHPDGGSRRLENRTNANEQAVAVARAILGDPRTYDPVPYFWSDQYGARLQVFGATPPDAEEHVVDGAVADGRFVVSIRKAGRPVGVVGWAMPKQARVASASLRTQLAAR